MNVRKVKQWLAPLLRTPLHPQWLLRHAPASSFANLRGTVLDVGCADMRAREALPPDCTYIGLDYPATAANLYGTRPVVYGDAQSLPFPDETFDAVLLLHVLEHVPNPSLAVTEALRVLGPQGQLVVETPFLYPVHDAPFDFQRWTPAGLQRLLEAHGANVQAFHAAGSPAETGTVMFNLGLSVVLLGWLRQQSPWLVLAPLVGLLILASNLIGWLIGRLYVDASIMPHRVRLVCEKRNWKGT